MHNAKPVVTIAPQPDIFTMSGDLGLYLDATATDVAELYWTTIAGPAVAR